MADEPSLFDQAADILQQALEATNIGKQSALLDEALRLNRLAVAQETAALAKIRATLSDPAQDGDSAT